MGKFKGIIFDLDDTLAYSPFNKSGEEGQPMPGVLDVLEALPPSMHRGVASNRAGAIWHEVTTLIDSSRKNNYPAPEQDAERIIAAAKALDLLKTQWNVSLYDDRARLALAKARPDLDFVEVLDNVRDRMHAITHAHAMGIWYGITAQWRKPEPGMLEAFCKVWNVEPEECIFVGDQDGTKLDRYNKQMVSDLLAAKNAGMQFVSATDIARIPEMIDL